jgi:hypothetical protein
VAITNPTLPWAIVLCQLEGSHPDPSIVTSMYELFVSNPRSLATFWRDQTYGAVDLTGSKVFGWYPCGWAIHTSPPEFLTPIHPGVTASVPRPTVVAQARQVLVNHNSPEILAEFRGVIAVYNFSVSGGFSGADVAYGLDGATSGLDWAESGWQQCQNCTSMIAPLGFNLPCTNTSVGAGHTRPGAYPDGTIPVFGVCTDALVAGTLGGFAACWKCGCLFDASMETGSVTCAAGARHGAAAGSPYYAMLWADPLNGGDGRNLYRCTNCGIVTHGTKTVTAGKTVISPATNLVCPATKVNHVLDVTELTFPRLDRAAYDRTFLAHEMGHAYGFQHGLGWRVQSLDLTDDCLPSAYGDRWTIMSAMNCDSVTPASTDVDAALGQSGPGLALHHLVTAGGLADLSSVVTAPITADGTVYTIRPPHDTTVPGVSGIRAGRCLIEMRDLKSWDTNLQDSDLPNRQSLAADGLSAGIALYDMTPMLPTRLMMPSGRPHLEAGEWFEDRHGLGGVRIEVETMTAAPPSATLRVTNTGESIVNRFQRWLILRTVYSDGTDPPRCPMRWRC